MRIHKKIATNKINIHTRLLRVCVFVFELKKSQPQAVISLENLQICRYALEPIGTVF